MRQDSFNHLPAKALREDLGLGHSSVPPALPFRISGSSLKSKAGMAKQRMPQRVRTELMSRKTDSNPSDCIAASCGAIRADDRAEIGSNGFDGRGFQRSLDQAEDVQSCLRLICLLDAGHGFGMARDEK